MERIIHQLERAPYSFRTKPVGQVSGIVRALLVTLSFLFTASHGNAEAVSREYQLKAAFLYNFIKFVEWTPDRFDSPNGPIVIGVLGANPFGDQLERAVRDRKVGNRAIHVRQIQSISDARSVELLFVAVGQEPRLGDNLQDIQNAGVLTVGESSQFASLGG